MDKSIHELGEELRQITARMHDNTYGGSYPSDDDYDRLWAIADILKNWEA